MSLIVYGPAWFYGYESIFAFVFSFVTLLISLLSFKAYGFTKDKKYNYFGLAFLLVCVANFVIWLFTTLVHLHWTPYIEALLAQFDFAFLLYILLSIIAYMVLLIIVIKIKTKKIILLLLSLSILFVVFSRENFLKFHITAFLLLFFLSYQFYTNYLDTGKDNAKYVFVCFYLLTCAEIFFGLSMLVHGGFYVVANIVQLIGYFVLFYVFLRIINHGRQKRKT